MKNKASIIFIVLAVVYLATGALTFLLSERGLSENGQATHLKISRSFASWTGTDIPMESNALDLIQPDAMIFRSYKGDTGIKVTLYVGFYLTMEKSDLAHSPLVCYTGQGWRYESDGNRLITPPEPYGNVRASSVIVQKGNYRELVWFWFQGKNYSSNILWRMRLKLFINELMGEETWNYFIRISTPIDQADIITSEEILIKFVNRLIPELSAVPQSVPQ